MVEGLKAYVCRDASPYSEGFCEIYFKKTNIEARKAYANEHMDGEIGGISCKREPRLDKFEASHKIPVSFLVLQMGWWFEECAYSGLRITEDLYYEGHEIYNFETKEYEWSEELVGKEPSGFLDYSTFACKEYEEIYIKNEKARLKWEREQAKTYIDIVLKRLPDAEIIHEDGLLPKPYIYSVNANGSFSGDEKSRVVEQAKVEFSYPGMKYWAALEMRRDFYNFEKYGPLKPKFICASGDLETFEAWAKEQKEKVNKNV